MPVLTSSRRFAGRSFQRTLLRWMTLQILSWLDVSQQTLGRFYPAQRDSGG